jgi:hypothetical protein
MEEPVVASSACIAALQVLVQGNVDKIFPDPEHHRQP